MPPESTLMTSFRKYFFLILIFFYSFLEASAQLETFQFQPLTYQVIEQVDAGNFAEAQLLLQSQNNEESIKEPALLAEQYFAQGYYELLSTGDQESFAFFTKAGRLYDSIGWQAHRYLCDVFIIVNIYIKSRTVETKERGKALLAEIPKEQLESRAILHNILGAAHSGVDMEYDKAQFHNRQALAFFLAQKNHRRLISIYGIMASCENNLGKDQQAIIYIDSAQYFAKKINNEKQIAFLQIRKFRALINQKKYKEAFSVLQLAEQYFLEHPTEQGQLDWIYGNYANAYADINDYKKAFEYQQKRMKINGENRILENDERTTQLMVQYETEKKEQQIKMQSLIIENQRQESQQLILGAISGLGFLLLLSGIGYFYYRNQQQEKLAHAQLHYQEQLLAATVNTQEAERKRISRDLHDGIGQQLSGLKLGFQQMTEKVSPQVPEQKEQLKKLEKIIRNAALDVRNLSHQMMPKSLQELGLAPAITDMMENTFPNTNIAHEFFQTNMEQRLPESIEIGLYRITQELVSNILKHANAKEVTIELLKNKQEIVLMVEDDGQGFSPAQIQKDGHGLTNIRSRLQAIKGEVHFESPQEGGTLVTVRVPFRS